MAGETDHAGEFLSALAGGVRVMPYMLVDAENLDAVEPCRIVSGGVEHWPDLGPQRVPRRAQLASQPLDGGVLIPQLTDRPGHRAGCQQGARGGDLRVLLGEGHDRAGRLTADPAVLAPSQAGRPSSGWGVDQGHSDASVAGRDDAATGTAGQPVAGLDVEDDGGVGDLGVDEMEVRQSEQDVTPGT